MQERDVPRPAQGQVRVRVRACGVCRTDLHLVDGELKDVCLPIVPGHQVVGIIDELGPKATRFSIGARIGVPWLGWTCGECIQCLRGRENLCERARFTGCHLDGGYAQYCTADERFCLPIPERYSDLEVAPLLCAGLIGFRSLRMAEDAGHIGFYGIGASAHLLIQVARAQGRNVYAFTREGDVEAQRFALELGAVWAGASTEEPPRPLDAAILFAPVGALVPRALKAVAPGGIVICAGIHMSAVPSFPYELLWGERVLRSVANLTRKDGEEFFVWIADHPVRARTQVYPLADAQRALDDLRHGRVQGAAVLTVA